MNRDIWHKAKYFAVLDQGRNAFVVTNDDHVYSIGINGESGPLGLNNSNPAFICQEIESLAGLGIQLLN